MTNQRDDPGIESTARWAFQLGYFLLQDRRDACGVLYQAVARLYVTALTQKKRQAKQPKGEVHKKLALTPGPLLQYLIYLCAEPYEYAQEQEHQARGGGVTTEDMIVRYIKHLMLLYLEHNSFYAAVGQSCILFDFETSQAGRLYETLVQCSTVHLDTKGDYSVRDAKREIRRRLAGRFGRFVTTYDGARKEQKFVPMADAGAHFRLVKRCLHRLQPLQEVSSRGGCWHLPARFEPAACDVAELQYDEGNADPSVEQSAELRRVHVVTHPCCWARLLRASRFNYSRRHIVLPEFTMMSDENLGRRPPDGRLHPPELNPSELEGLARMLRSEARRRKGIFASQLFVTVDGEPRDSWSVGQEGEVKIKVGADARVLAVSARDEEGEVLLAQYLLQLWGSVYGREVGPASLALEGGQEFTFKSSPDPEAPGEGFVVVIGFRETELRRVALRYVARSYGRIAMRASGSWPRLPKLKVAVTACACLLGLLLISFWVARNVRRTQHPPVIVDNTARPPTTPGGGPAPEGRGDAPPGPVAAIEQPKRSASPDTGRSPSRGRASGGPPSSSGTARVKAADKTTPKILFTLQDGGGLVSLTERGGSKGLEGLPPEWRRAVEATLRARRVDRPYVPEALGGGTEMLLGAPGKAGGVIIVGPYGVIEGDRPSFRWRGPGGEVRYIVTVFDSRYNRVAQSGLLSAAEWRPSEGLRRGNTYVWKVTSLHDGKATTSPAPPAPEARFQVLGRAAADELARARRLRPGSHLVLGVLYARAGLADEAEREFRALAESNPDSSVARSLLSSVQDWRRPR